MDMRYKAFGKGRNRPGVGKNKRIGRKRLEMPEAPITAAQQDQNAHDQRKAVIFQHNQEFFHDAGIRSGIFSAAFSITSSSAAPMAVASDRANKNCIK